MENGFLPSIVDVVPVCWGVLDLLLPCSPQTETQPVSRLDWFSFHFWWLLPRGGSPQNIWCTYDFCVLGFCISAQSWYLLKGQTNKMMVSLRIWWEKAVWILFKTLSPSSLHLSLEAPHSSRFPRRTCPEQKHCCMDSKDWGYGRLRLGRPGLFLLGMY